MRCSRCLVFALRASGLLVFDARELFGAVRWRYGMSGSPDSCWSVCLRSTASAATCSSRWRAESTASTAGCARSARTGERAARHPDSNGQNALGFWTAALLLSFGFGFVHRTNAGESPIGLLSAGLISVVFCLSLWRTGSLWWAIGFHAAWDWAQSFLYGVADSGMVIQGHLFSTHPVGRPLFSGGLTGPEGSILSCPSLD